MCSRTNWTSRHYFGHFSYVLWCDGRKREKAQTIIKVHFLQRPRFYQTYSLDRQWRPWFVVILLKWFVVILGSLQTILGGSLQTILEGSLQTKDVIDGAGCMLLPRVQRRIHGELNIFPCFIQNFKSFFLNVLSKILKVFFKCSIQDFSKFFIFYSGSQWFFLNINSKCFSQNFQGFYEFFHRLFKIFKCFFFHFPVMISVPQ